MVTAVAVGIVVLRLWLRSCVDGGLGSSSRIWLYLGAALVW
jgi:hypothetical protein